MSMSFPCQKCKKYTDQSHDSSPGKWICKECTEPGIHAAKFTKLERDSLWSFLKDLSDHQSNAGCNDFKVPNTEEGRALIRAVYTNYYTPEAAEEEIANTLDTNRDHFYTMDSWVLDHLWNKLTILLAD